MEDSFDKDITLATEAHIAITMFCDTLYKLIQSTVHMERLPSCLAHTNRNGQV